MTKLVEVNIIRLLYEANFGTIKNNLSLSLVTINGVIMATFRTQSEKKYETANAMSLFPKRQPSLFSYFQNPQVGEGQVMRKFMVTASNELNVR